MDSYAYYSIVKSPTCQWILQYWNFGWSDDEYSKISLIQFSIFKYSKIYTIRIYDGVLTTFWLEGGWAFVEKVQGYKVVLFLL